MKTMPVGDFKARFSEVLDLVKHGEEVVISYGRSKEPVAVLVPYASYRSRNAVATGALAAGGSVRFADDFEMTDEELVDP